MSKSGMESIMGSGQEHNTRMLGFRCCQSPLPNQALGRGDIGEIACKRGNLQRWRNFRASLCPFHPLTQLCPLSHCPPRALAIVSVAELVNGRCLRCQYRRHDDWTRGPPVIGWTTRVRPARVSRRVPVPRAESLHPMIPSTQQATNLDGFEVAIHRPFSIAPRF